VSPYRGFVPIADEVLKAAREAARDVVAAIVEQAVDRAKPRPRPMLMVDTIDPLVEIARIACRKFDRVEASRMATERATEVVGRCRSCRSLSIVKIDERDFEVMPMDEAARTVGRSILDLMGCSCVARPEAVRQ